VRLRLAAGTDGGARELLLCLVERLGHEQETGWLDSVVQELVGVADQLSHANDMVRKGGGRVWTSCRTPAAW
jgi:hypothetical protein